MKKNNIKKVVAVLLAVIVVAGCSIGATVAYLQMKTTTITNTFTSSDVSITLTETTPTEADRASIKMVPGAKIPKNPTVTVLANSEQCYLFVKVEKSGNFDTYMISEIVNEWTQLTNETDVYYRVVDTKDTDQLFPVLVGNQVTVNPDVTKTEMALIDGKADTEAAANAEIAARPTMSFTAYAIQFDYLADKDGNGVVNQLDAWILVNG